MTIIKDLQGNVLEHLDALGGQVVIDNRLNQFNLSLVNTEVVLSCKNTNSASIDVRGVFSGTLVAEYSINGVDYINASLFNPLTELFVPGITTVGKGLA